MSLSASQAQRQRKAPVMIGNVAVGRGRTKIISSLTESNVEETLARADVLARDTDIDLVELRVDCLVGELVPSTITRLAGNVAACIAGNPLVLTFRTSVEGGRRVIAPELYADIYDAAIDSRAVDAVDIELAMISNPAIAAMRDRAIERGITGVVDQQRDVVGDAGSGGNLIGIGHVQRQCNQTAVATFQHVAQRCGVTCSDVDFADPALEQFFHKNPADTSVGACHQGHCIFDFHGDVLG